MRKLIDLAFERLENLWEAWCESRHVNRTWITETFTLNVEIIVKYGSKEDLEVLLHYTQGFEDVLPEGIANSIEEVRKRIA
jgi:hypothetical protein